MFFDKTISPFLKEILSGSQIDNYVNHICQQIEDKKHLNCFVRTYPDYIKEQLQQLIIALREKKKKPLAGLLVGIKDLFSLKNYPLQASSNILQGFIAQFTATCICLLQEAGAVIIGHNNCDEFGMGSSNEFSLYGAVQHPTHPGYTSGGSSGGGASAVAANLCDVALGSDTGGSVRLPAAFCGIFGLRPTYGAISRYGMIAHASSFDTVGIFAREIDSLAMTFAHMAKEDISDNTSLPFSSSSFWKNYKGDLQKSCKIAFLSEDIWGEKVEEKIGKAVRDLKERFISQGFSVEEIDIPLFDKMLPTYYTLTAAEASSNLARYDGIRYDRKLLSEKAEGSYKKIRTCGFGKEVQRRIIMGTHILTNYSLYEKADKVRRKIRSFFIEELFKKRKIDFIFSPVVAKTAHLLNQVDIDPLQNFMNDFFLVPASIAGIPALSFPYGKDDEEKPIGIQIMGRPLEESKMLFFVKKCCNRKR